jgi:hypothetical protein
MFLLKTFVGCEGLLQMTIPGEIPFLLSTVFRLIQIAVPILLIFMGTIDLVRAITQGKEDDIKKGQAIFLKRLIAAILVFLVVSIVQVVFSLLGNANANNKGIMGCANCLITNSSSCYR